MMTLVPSQSNIKKIIIHACAHTDASATFAINAPRESSPQQVYALVSTHGTRMTFHGCDVATEIIL